MGYNIEVATICGGLAKSELFIQTNSDILQLRIVKPHQVESVLLGAAMLGAAAAKSHQDKDASKRYTYLFISLFQPLAIFYVAPSKLGRIMLSIF